MTNETLYTSPELAAALNALLSSTATPPTMRTARFTPVTRPVNDDAEGHDGRP